MNEDRMPNYEEVDLMDYLKVVWKWKYLIIIGTVVCAAIAGVVSLSLPKVYETTEVIEIGKVVGSSLTNVKAVKSIMESESFADEVIHTLNLNENPRHLLERIKVQVTNGTNMLKICLLYTSPSPRDS